MSYRHIPQDTKIVGITPIESKLREHIIRVFRRCPPDHIIEDMVRGFKSYWKGQIDKIQLFRATKMKSYSHFLAYFGEYL